jgi:exodeoxyribonuclease VII small subunit
MSPRKKTERSFEDGLRELEEVLDAIESGDLGLEETLARYERGVGLYRELTGLLRGAEETVARLTRDLEGVEREEPFEADEEG